MSEPPLAQSEISLVPQLYYEQGFLSSLDWNQQDNSKRCHCER